MGFIGLVGFIRFLGFLGFRVQVSCMILDGTCSRASRLIGTRSSPDLKELSSQQDFPSCFAALQSYRCSVRKV